MNKTSGIEVADKLSIKHIRSSIENLSQVSRGDGGHKVIDFNEKHAQALIAIALKVKTRKH
jgi:hypothetical protein